MKFSIVIRNSQKDLITSRVDFIQDIENYDVLDHQDKRNIVFMVLTMMLFVFFIFLGYRFYKNV